MVAMDAIVCGKLAVNHGAQILVCLSAREQPIAVPAMSVLEAGLVKFVSGMVVVFGHTQIV